VSSYLLAFYCLFRKKNVCPESSEPSGEKTLRRNHLEIDKDNNVVYVYCNFSKTNQFGSSDLVIPVPGNEDPKLDLVRHLTNLLAAVVLILTSQLSPMLLESLSTTNYSQTNLS
jgi:hypothetical protein